jgi:O-antigen ligase
MSRAVHDTPRRTDTAQATHARTVVRVRAFRSLTGLPFLVLARRAAYTVLFMACVYPISFAGISINYLFLLLPFAFALLQGRTSYPGRDLASALVVFFLIFFAATLYQLDFATLSLRRFASFVVFVSMFAYAFIRIEANQVAAFKTALVAISVYLSFLSAYELLTLGATRTVGFEAKDLVGTQRFGFIYLVAIWLAYLDPQIKRLLGPLRYPVLAVLLAGLMLTFSRSSIVALLAGAGMFIVVRHGRWLTNISFRGVLSAIGTIVALAALVVFLFWMFPLAFEFFDVRLLRLLSDGQNVERALGDQTSSEGARLVIAARALEFVVRNPFTGSGFLGVWVIPAFPGGSAHSQYVDVLFRTGFMGFFVYLWIIGRLLRFLWREQEPLFWGALSVLVYGLFHETFKESQGGFVLAFLIGMMAQSAREHRATRRASLKGSPPSLDRLEPARG